MGWQIKPVTEMPDPISNKLSSVQRALAEALHMELQTQEEEPAYWAAFMPQYGTDPIEIVFCPMKSNEVVGSMKISREGDITDREGVADRFIQ